MIVIAGPNKGFTVIGNLVKGTHYAVKVRAVTSAGESPYFSLTYEGRMSSFKSFIISSFIRYVNLCYAFLQLYRIIEQYCIVFMHTQYSLTCYVNCRCVCLYVCVQMQLILGLQPT